MSRYYTHARWSYDWWDAVVVPYILFFVVFVLPFGFCWYKVDQLERREKALGIVYTRVEPKPVPYTGYGNWQAIGGELGGCQTYKLNGSEGWFHEPTTRTVCK